MGNATTQIGGDLARLLRRNAAAFGRAWPLAVAGDVTGVHKARVASRRLREILPMAGAGADAPVRGLRRRIRRITRALGGVRELDVTRTLLVEESARRDWPVAPAARVDRHLSAARDDARRHLLARLGATPAADIVVDVGAVASRIERGVDREAALSVLASRAGRRLDAFRAALEHAGTLYEPEALHAVRIATKKLRYVLELAVGAAGAPFRRDVSQLESLQEELGRIHDLQVLQHRLLSAAASPPGDRTFARRLDRWHESLEAECRERHAAFLLRAPLFRSMIDRLSPRVTASALSRRPRSAARKENSAS
jgi:CHAD domain-containing protein